MWSPEANMKEKIFSVFHILCLYIPGNTIPCQRNETIYSGSGMRMWKKIN